MLQLGRFLEMLDFVAQSLDVVGNSRGQLTSRGYDDPIARTNGMHDLVELRLDEHLPDRAVAVGVGEHRDVGETDLAKLFPPLVGLEQRVSSPQVPISKAPPTFGETEGQVDPA